MKPYMKTGCLVVLSLFLAANATLAQASDSIANDGGSLSDTARIDLLLKLSNDMLASDPRQAFALAGDALEIAQGENDKRRTGLALESMAAVYRITGSYDKALEYLLEALTTFESEKDTAGMAHCLDQLGQVHRMAEDFSTANGYFTKALDFNRKKREFRGIAANYLHMGTSYIEADSLDKGLSYYLVALLIADSLNLAGEKVELLNRIGESYSRMGKHEEALASFYKVLELLGNEPDAFEKASALIHIGTGYYNRENFAEALKYAKQGYELADSEGFVPLVAEAAQLLSNLAAARGDYRQAYMFFTRYKELSDSLLGVERSAQMAKIRVLYDLGRSEAENASLRNQNVKRLRILRSQSVVIFTIASLLAIMGVLLYFLNRINNRQLTLNATLKDQGKELESLNDQKDKFFSFVAHNLKNPFNTIMGFAELMQRSANDNDPAKARQYASLIYELSSQVQRVLANLLDWSRLQRRSFECKPEMVELTGLIRDVLEMNNREAARKDIHITLSDRGPVNVTADRAMIATVLQNLVTNAIQFTSHSGLINIETREEGPLARVTVTDNGVGISEENLNRIFHFDFSQSKITAGDTGGAGLGLIICREMIQKNGGTITVNSQLGNGSNFSFTLPSAASAPASLASPEGQTAEAALAATDLLMLNDDFPPDALPEILLSLVPRFEEVSRVLSIENLDMFSQAVMQIAEKYNMPDLIRFGNTLTELTRAHQIDQILKMLPKFRIYLDRLAE